jgi:hypothetical protein
MASTSATAPGSTSPASIPEAGAGAAGIGVQPARAREGKDAVHAFAVQNDRFHLPQKIVLFGERQVAEAAQLRLHGALHDFDAQGQRRDDDPRQRHVARRIAARQRERRHGDDPNRSFAARRKREDPRPERVAADVLDILDGEEAERQRAELGLVER